MIALSFILLNLGIISNINLDNSFIVQKFLFKIEKMNWIERKVIARMDFDEIKEIIFWKDDDVEDFKCGKKDISKENEDNQVIYFFQAKKNIKDKIAIIEGFLRKYKDEEHKMDKLIAFFENLKKEYRNELKSKVLRNA